MQQWLTNNLCWQEVTGYGRRALVETEMGRYEQVIGQPLSERSPMRPRSEGVKDR